MVEGKENTLINMAADITQTEGLGLVKPLQLLFLHLLQNQRLFHNRLDLPLLLLKIQLLSLIRQRMKFLSLLDLLKYTHHHQRSLNLKHHHQNHQHPQYHARLR